MELILYYTCFVCLGSGVLCVLVGSWEADSNGWDGMDDPSNFGPEIKWWGGKGVCQIKIRRQARGSSNCTKSLKEQEDDGAIWIIQLNVSLSFCSHWHQKWRPYYASLVPKTLLFLSSSKWEGGVSNFPFHESRVNNNLRDLLVETSLFFPRLNWLLFADDESK